MSLPQVRPSVIRGSFVAPQMRLNLLPSWDYNSD
jgi:hypothetical protein